MELTIRFCVGRYFTHMLRTLR